MEEITERVNPIAELIGVFYRNVNSNLAVTDRSELHLIVYSSLIESNCCLVLSANLLSTFLFIFPFTAGLFSCRKVFFLHLLVFDQLQLII